MITFVVIMKERTLLALLFGGLSLSLITRCNDREDAISPIDTDTVTYFTITVRPDFFSNNTDIRVAMVHDTLGHLLATRFIGNAIVAKFDTTAEAIPERFLVTLLVIPSGTGSVEGETFSGVRTNEKWELKHAYTPPKLAAAYDGAFRGEVYVSGIDQDLNQVLASQPFTTNALCCSGPGEATYPIYKCFCSFNDIYLAAREPDNTPLYKRFTYNNSYEDFVLADFSTFDNEVTLTSPAGRHLFVEVQGYLLDTLQYDRGFYVTNRWSTRLASQYSTGQTKIGYNDSEFPMYRVIASSPSADKRTVHYDFLGAVPESAEIDYADATISGFGYSDYAVTSVDPLVRKMVRFTASHTNFQVYWTIHSDGVGYMRPLDLPVEQIGKLSGFQLSDLNHSETHLFTVSESLRDVIDQRFKSKPRTQAATVHTVIVP